MKKQILNKIVCYTKTRKWHIGKKRVLIQLNSHFSKEEWLNKLSFFKEKYDFYFTKNKYEFLKLVVTADYVFCFSFSSYIEVSKLRCDKIYFGLVGLEFLEKINFPDNIKIYNPKGISKDAIAEYCLSMALVLKLKLFYSFNNKCKKKWDQKLILSNPFTLLKNKRIGIMGVGNNGMEIAKIFKRNGCKINAYDKNKYNNSNIDKWFQISELNAFLSDSDIIIIALPETCATKSLLNIDQFKKMKKDAILINIGRGSIINTNDFETAVEKKMFFGAALDTFLLEPLPKKSKLWKYDNVLITPHISGNINLFREQIIDDFIKKIL